MKAATLIEVLRAFVETEGENIEVLGPVGNDIEPTMETAQNGTKWIAIW